MMTRTGEKYLARKDKLALKDQELVLRALAMIQMRDEYSSPMRDFLNDFAGETKKISADRLTELEGLFRESIKIIKDAIGKSAFRPVLRSTPQFLKLLSLDSPRVCNRTISSSPLQTSETPMTGC
jgi:hypothetical protein